MADTRKLSALKVARLTKPGLYGDGGGLYLQVTSPVARSWIFKFQRGGRQRMMGLGSLDIVPLAEARDKAIDCRRLLLDGIDPIDARDARQAADEARGRQVHHLRGMRYRLCQSPPSGLGERQTRHAVGELAFDPLLSRLRLAGRAGHRYRPRHACPSADVVDQGSDRGAAARPNRSRPRLGHRARISEGREPRPLARASRQAFAEARPGPKGQAFPRAAVCRKSAPSWPS